MNNIIGLLIEDDKDDIASFKDAFKLDGITLVELSSFPQSLDDFYKHICNINSDFIIIDNHLDKKTALYNGLDILEEIRKNDPEIHIVYLTSKEFEESKLNKFDQAVKKEKLSVERKIVSERIKRAVSRDVSVKLEREIEESTKFQKDYFDTQIKMLDATLKAIGSKP